jgi:hypothetical protein
MSALPETSRFRSCPLCEAICGLELRYAGSELRAIRGDAADPFSRGHILSLIHISEPTRQIH